MKPPDTPLQLRPQRRRRRKRAIGPKPLGRIEITHRVEKRDRKVIAFGQRFAFRPRYGCSIGGDCRSETPAEKAVELRAGALPLVRAQLQPAELEQGRDIVVVVVCKTLLVEPAIGITVVADLDQGVDQFWPIPDPALEVTGHVESETEISRPQALSADLVACPKEPGDRVLPSGDKPADDHLKAGVPPVIRGQTPQDQSNEIGGRKVELLALVDPVLRQARDEETLEVAFQPVWIVDPIEKTWRFAIEIGCQQVVDRGVELQKPDVCAGAVTAFLVRIISARRRRQGRQAPDSLEVRADAGYISGVFEPPAKLSQRLAQARGVDADSLVTIEPRFDRSNIGLQRHTEIGHRRKICNHCPLRAPAGWSPQCALRIHYRN